MLRIPHAKCVYSMNPTNPPAAEAVPGDTVVFETKDCFSNRIQTENDLPESVGWESINPATGPLRVTGAEPGDALVVSILDIKVASRGCMTAIPGKGALGHRISHSQTKIVPIEVASVAGASRDARAARDAGAARDIPVSSGVGGRCGGLVSEGFAVFNDRLRLPIRPMIGVIGTAPAAGDVPTGTPGPHGSNMDTRLIATGATLYLPVFVPGANLSLGDLHAVMADGEVVICGVEVAGEVTVRVNLIRARNLPSPLSSPVLETAEAFYCIASAKGLDEASAAVLDQTADFLAARLPLSGDEIALLMSLVCNLQVSQIVDPLRTVRMEMPKEVFAAYGLRFGT